MSHSLANRSLLSGSFRSLVERFPVLPGILFEDRSTPVKKPGGFTIIEVVLAISILAIIMSVTYSVLSQIVRTKQMLDDSREVKAIVNSILIRMTREIQLARAGFPLLPDPDKIDQPNKPSVNLIGESIRLPNDLSGDRLTFLAAQGGQYLPDGTSHSGDVQITYRVEEDPEQKGNPQRTFYLIREEIPYMRSAEKAYQQGMVFPVTNKLVSLSFRFFDPKSSKWVSSWGTNSSYVKLPKLVEFEVRVKSQNGTIESFKTAVALRSVADSQ